MHKITLFGDGVRKLLRPKFWSLGTARALGPVYRQDVKIGFCRLWFLVIWDPYDYPILVAPQGQAKNPEPTRSRCVTDDTSFNTLKKLDSDVIKNCA